MSQLVVETVAQQLTDASTGDVLLIAGRRDTLDIQAFAVPGDAVIPVNTALPVITGTLSPGNTLSLSNGSWTSSPTDFTRQWFRDAVALSGETGATFAVPGDGSWHNAVITATVVATNEAGSSAAATAAGVTILAVVPSFQGTPSINGTMQPGNTVNAVYNPSGTNPITPTFQWKNGGVNISGATASSLALTEDMVGDLITVTITLTNAAGFVSVTTSAREVVAAPVNTVAPAISGSSDVGATLTLSDGTWTGYPALTFTYEWFADAVAIDGETTNELVITQDPDVIITAEVTATNSEGAATEPASNAVTVTAPSGDGDPLWDQVEVMINFRGADESTTFVDEKGNTVTSTGAPEIDTAEYPAGAMVLDGASYVSVSGLTPLGTDDCTIEIWMEVENPLSEPGYFQLSPTAGGIQASYSDGICAFASGSTEVFAFIANNEVDTSIAYTPGMHHLVCERVSGVWTTYVDGVAGSPLADATDYATATDLAIGGYYSGSYLGVGPVLAFRYTRGVARYNGAFTSPSLPLPTT